LEKKIKNLEQEVKELKQKQQTKHDVWQQTITRIILYGTVASSITAIVNLIVAVLHLVKKN
jgi:hypothetical protein